MNTFKKQIDSKLSDIVFNKITDAIETDQYKSIVDLLKIYNLLIITKQFNINKNKNDKDFNELFQESRESKLSEIVFNKATEAIQHEQYKPTINLLKAYKILIKTKTQNVQDYDNPEDLNQLLETLIRND